MVKGIVWAAEAQEDFAAVILYLEEEWGVASTRKFVKNVFDQIDKLLAMPSIARFTTQPGIQIYPIDKKNVLFFMIEDELLILLSIYPYKKDIEKSKYF